MSRYQGGEGTDPFRVDVSKGFCLLGAKNTRFQELAWLVIDTDDTTQ